MIKYICKDCGNPSYSSAEIEHLREKDCPKCGGEIAPTDPKKPEGDRL